MSEIMSEVTDVFNKQRIDKTRYEALLKHFRLNITEKYVFPPEIVQVHGTTIATVGNFSASTGKPKSKKTFNVSAIVAAALSGKEVLRYKAELPPDKQRILYIDTEQSKYHCHKVLERVLKLADLPTDRECNRIDFFVLREYSPSQRRDIINWALHEDRHYGLVIIDGIRDLIHDINNPSEALDIINELMRWSSYYELHIHTVLHLNKGDDNTPIGKTAFHKAIDAEAYTISVDTKGELLWDSDIVEDLPLICIVSEKASTEYLHYLESKHISWIAAGENHIDLCSAAEILYSEFGIKRMAIVGGGTINAAFMQAGLIDEISVLIGAGVDGRSGQTSVFYGIKDDKKSVTTFSLISAERYKDTSCVWIKYRSK